MSDQAQVYTAAKMREQLETLASEAASLLLFLRNVERCEVLVWKDGAAQPQLLHSCTVQVHALDWASDAGCQAEVVWCMRDL